MVTFCLKAENPTYKIIIEKEAARREKYRLLSPDIDRMMGFRLSAYNVYPTSHWLMTTQIPPGKEGEYREGRHEITDYFMASLNGRLNTLYLSVCNILGLKREPFGLTEKLGFKTLWVTVDDCIAFLGSAYIVVSIRDVKKSKQALKHTGYSMADTDTILKKYRQYLADKDDEYRAVVSDIILQYAKEQDIENHPCPRCGGQIFNTETAAESMRVAVKICRFCAEQEQESVRDDIMDWYIALRAKRGG